jgi:hypothetical protein
MLSLGRRLVSHSPEAPAYSKHAGPRNVYGPAVRKKNRSPPEMLDRAGFSRENNCRNRILFCYRNNTVETVAASLAPRRSEQKTRPRIRSGAGRRLSSMRESKPLHTEILTREIAAGAASAKGADNIMGFCSGSMQIAEDHRFFVSCSLSHSLSASTESMTATAMRWQTRYS